MGLGIPDVKGELADFKSELAAIRKLLEQLLELELKKTRP